MSRFGFLDLPTLQAFWVRALDRFCVINVESVAEAAEAWNVYYSFLGTPQRASCRSGSETKRYSTIRKGAGRALCHAMPEHISAALAYGSSSTAQI